MKTSVSLTLIICGTLLVFVPLIDDILGVRDEAWFKEIRWKGEK